jgi:protein-S-isoprenylcysteine O-methyltransferase Ste14
LGAVLLFVRPPLEGVGWRGGLWGRHAPLLAFPGIVGDACILLAMAGFALCWWARLHLGRFWSGFVGVKTDHRIVDTGPFGLVRHPIYLGLTLAALALALVKATPEALLGAALIFAGFALTARREEAFLSAQLGAAAYDDYRRRVPGLGPF